MSVSPWSKERDTLVLELEKVKCRRLAESNAECTTLAADAKRVKAGPYTRPLFGST